MFTYNSVAYDGGVVYSYGSSFNVTSIIFTIDFTIDCAAIDSGVMDLIVCLFIMIKYHQQYFY